ncbi:uncharacterized protein LOC107038481 isoform X2 [Diachasma alloeum]|uniref:uncharacterized protein LOC107038481 isoform X2 n=1 Tax=Diachasma alloeum TaxID=454923 RepID=UPI0007381D88|nr:uncharacterized protein LOC107038481 isoform X2 [Diachasma alloeum]
MDDYEKKFAEMQKYIPFLEAMIERLQKVTDKSREVQLHKMQQLHGILTDSKRKLRIETLQKCEDVLQKLHSKVEKFQGTSAGLNFPSSKKSEEPTVSKTKPVTPLEVKLPREVEKSKEKPKEMDETPASPSPPASPDEQPKSTSAPIIIPTERKRDYSSGKIDSKPSSPDQIERVSTKQPIIIPTERKGESSNNFVDNNSLAKARNDKSLNNAFVDSRNASNCRHIPTVTVSTKLETQKQIRLTSPECRSPRSKEFLSPSKSAKPPVPLLISPPRVLTEPPLSMDDLAELLNDGSDNNPGSSNFTILISDKNSSNPIKPEKIRISKGKPSENSNKPDKEHLKSFVLTQEDIDRESNRRWEERDKHIVLYGRKGLQADGKPLPTPQSEHSSVPLITTAPKKPEFRNSPMSPVGKDRGSEPRYADNYERIPRHVTDRFSNVADQPKMPDINVINSAFSRLSEGDKANLAKLQTNLPILHQQTENHTSAEERDVFSRRGGAPQMDMDMEYRRDEEYYMQRPIHPSQNREYYNPQWGGYEHKPQQMPGHPYPHPPNHPQNLPPHHPNHPSNIPNHPHQSHPDMWMGPNPGPGPIDHPVHHMSPQYSPNLVRRPMMSPPGRIELSHGPYGDPNFPEDIGHSPQPPAPPVIPSLMSTPPFNPRGFPENRAFEAPFERPAEFGLNMRPNPWEGHPGDPNYPEPSRVRGPEVSYNAPVPPGPPSWNRGPGPDLQPIRNRSVERFPGDRATNRPALTDPQHPGFNRRSEWDRPGPTENPPRFNREGRNVSERDPRFRKDQSPQGANSPNATSAKRDPRLVKEPAQPAASKSKENSVTNRDPRRRNCDLINQNKPIISSKAPRNKNKSKNFAKQKESTKSTDIKARKSSDEKISTDKLIKDKETMQSPLESLYGVIDTTAKTGKGYGLQKFKIPKIKRTDPPVPPRPPTPPKPSAAVELESWDEEPPPKPAESVKSLSAEADKTVKVEEKKMEVSSTTDEPAVLSAKTKANDRDLKVSEAEPTVSNHVSKKCDKVDESEATVDTSTPAKIADTLSTTTATAKETPKEEEPPTFKNEITRELIEKMIKTSLEQGEGKKLLEQAKLLQKLGEGLAHSKKFKKIRKIIESQSDSSSSDTEQIIEPKRIGKKKRRVIVSDSSDDASPERKSPEVPEIDFQEKPKTPKRRARKPRQSKSPRFKGKPVPEEDKSEELKESVNDSKESVNDSKESVNDSKESVNDSKESVNESKESVNDSKESVNESKESVNDSKESVNKSKVSVDDSKESVNDSKESVNDSKESVNAPEQPLNDSKEPEQEPEPERELESPALKPRRKPARRRNSLEMLQEDIREMFISEGVVTATGHRMCRLIKEAEERHDSELSEDEVLPKRRNRSKSKTPKPREVPDDDKPKPRIRRTRKRAAKLSKQYVSSSDSDSRPNRLRESSSRRGTPEPSKDPTDAETPRETPADEPEGTPTLRRSERVSLREPRVMIEKTDLGKIDSSKIMFDTSSDESFGIDVSELTAAVDISLHSERQKRSDDDTEAMMSIKKLEEKPSKTKKRISDEPRADIASKPDDEATGVASDDASISSGHASSVKKLTTTSEPSNTNEELIKNILGDFVNDKNEESEKSIDKESVMEAEKEIVQPRKIIRRKKPALPKRKKKRRTWQMGIVSKSKKNKKTPIARSPTVPKPSLAPLTPSEPPKEDAESQENVEPPIVPPPKLEKVDIKSKSNESPIKSTIKREKDDCEPFLTPDRKRSCFKTEDLIEYAWTGQEKYKCLFCSFSGKNIVHHYKAVHPKDEMMISRLTLLDAKRAIDESKDEMLLELSEKTKVGADRKYACRFCVFTAEGQKESAMETFYEHCTTHTGEYRFRCRSCTYQTPLKSSMRAHYYKVCRKNYENFTLAVDEDLLPDEDLVNGYLCSLCNFIQLKEENVKKHIDKYHKDDLATEIIKIDMSIYLDLKNHGEHSDIEDELRSEDPLAPDSDASTVDLYEYTKQKRKKMTITRGKVENTSKNTGTKETNVSSLSKSGAPQGEVESPLSRKLSAFVCPPEIENKDVEIQRERQKTMQELWKNCGTNLQNKSTREGLSIIDKLTDKMRTQGTESEGGMELEGGDEIDESQHNVLPPVRPEENNDERTDPTPEKPSESISAPLSDVVPPQTITKVEHSDHEMSQEEEETDKSEKKPRDPLMSLEETPKDFNSAEETSDGEQMGEISRTYDESSDTSDGISDSELATDVNTLLKETITTSTNAPMMTTIQRLAAQLQGSKSTENSPTKPETSKPIVVPLCNLRSFVEKQKLLEKSQEVPDSDTSRSNTPKNFIRLRRLSGDKLSSGTPIPEPPPSAEEEKSQEFVPLQVIPQPIERQEGECSFLKIENVISLAPNTSSDPESPLIDDIRKAVATSPMKNIGISVLKKSSPNILKKTIRKPIGKIDGILSRFPPIAPTPPNQTFVLQPLPKGVVPKKSIITTTNKTVTTKPVTPALKPVTIPKPIAPGPKPVTMPPKAISPSIQKIPATKITPTARNVQVTHHGKNYKLLKLVRTPGLKPKESTPTMPSPKEKTFDAFTTMLQSIKLRHLYKCMDKTCTYSTDSADMFGQHYNSHVQKQLAAKPDSGKVVKTVHGYQKCAYCHENTMGTWEELLAHYKKKHTFCAYQCGYCFYRAFTQSYVDLHQTSAHPGKPSSVILGKRDHHPVEIIDRRENVHPFVCKHECNKLFYVPEAFVAHLKMKHGATLSIFKCHMCPASALKAEALIAHYKMHCIYKYQCLYCLFGADAPMELHLHLSHIHCNRPPKILERSLPPAPVRDKDVLLQLIIRNLDDDFKCSELKNVVENPIDGGIKRVRKETMVTGGIKTYTTSKKQVKSFGQAEVIDLLDGEAESRNLVPLTSDNIVLTEGPSMLKLPDGAVVEKQLASTIHDNSKDSNSSNQLLIQQEPELIVRYASEKLKTQIDNAVDPLSISRDVDMSDEFVNINVLDNPEFLRSAEQRDSERSPEMNPVEEEKNDDSDIEILECIEHPSKPKLQLTPIKESLRPFLRLKEEVKESESGRTTPTVVCSSNEDSNASAEVSGSTEVSAPLEFDNNEIERDSEIIEKPPSSLDDIKHSGFCGKELYKCGYDGCNFGAVTPGALKVHIASCSHVGENVQLKCVHCTKRFVKVGNLIDHFKIHGPKRFGCSLCNLRYPLACQAIAHMKTKHKISSNKLVPADPGNPSPDALFIVQPLGPGERRKRKFGKTKSFDSTQKEPTVFGPNDIDSLPRQAIYNQEVRCAVCPYTTKVRTNIIRHLQLHAKDEYVPESGPVNPVPCLDKKEKMFDKMVNLASSSHQNGRMGAKNKETVTDSEAELMPKFVPEKQRYVCCVVDCNCLTINEDLLRCHLKALHPEESFFRCPHCPPPGQDTQSIPIDKLGVHLKMHDTRLYKCSHCNHHHYHRHVVERHLTDKHPEKRPFVKVIREIENPEGLEKAPTEETEEGIADPDGNHWKCNVCDYKCIYKTEMITHASTSHDEKSQFKCTGCPFKTSGKISFEQHIISKHINDSEVDCTMVYERIRGTKKPDSVETPPVDEPFDTTPLWRRDMPRIRHIRGILLEEDNAKKSSESPKSGKRKSDVEPTAKPAKIKAKSMSFDGTVIIEKTKNPGASKLPEKIYTHEELQEKFGPYGRPNGNMYFCTICSNYNSKYRQEIRDHLFMELKYWRWHCKECGHLTVSHTRMLKHEYKVHKDKKPLTVELVEKEDIDQWVLNLMNTQRDIMREEVGDAAPSAIKSKVPLPTPISPLTITLEDSGEKVIASSSMETTAESSKIVDLTAAISKLTRNEESDDEDDDGNALVIDSKELEDGKDTSFDQIDKAPPKESKKMYICKHCNVEFAGLRGFKIHVQINHLKRLAFVCPYCDRSTNSETMMKTHIRKNHQGEEEKIIKNPYANGPELSNTFWEKEYGIVIPKKLKKKKRKIDDVDNTTIDEDKLPLSDICAKCGFTAINSTGLAAHMRAHAKRDSLKCVHCSFTANSQVDIWQHSEINHPDLDWKAEEIRSGISSTDPPVLHIKKRHVDDYNEDIEEEPTALSVGEPERSLQRIYTCFYCKNVRSLSLPTIRSHWNQYHKDVNALSICQTGVPFKFTESISGIPDTEKQVKCSYCPMKGSTIAVKAHIRKKHGKVPLRLIEIVDDSQTIWICKWCDEKVKGVDNKTSHHNMFHSHLAMRFQMEEKVVKERGFACPACPFVNASLGKMRTHVVKHAEVFKCKRCLKTFNSLPKATQHSTNEHAGLAAAIEKAQTNVEALMSKVSQSDLVDVPEEEPSTVPSTDIFRNLGVARKSTTKQLLKKPSSGVKSVARKSTHPLPRYPPGLKFDIEGLDSEGESLTKPVGWSYYGRPPTPINLANLNTVMSLGVAKMKVKCTKLAKLMNIDAQVILVDFKKQKTK